MHRPWSICLDHNHNPYPNRTITLQPVTVETALPGSVLVPPAPISHQMHVTHQLACDSALLAANFRPSQFPDSHQLLCSLFPALTDAKACPLSPGSL